MANIFRSETDINSALAELYELQDNQIHIHFVRLDHECDSEINRDALLQTVPIHPCIKVFYYDQSVSSLIKTLQGNLKENTHYPSSRTCPACGILPQDADIEDEGSESDNSN